MKFYLTENTNKNEPTIDCDYVHIKAKTDGSQTAIISEDLIIHEDVEEKGQEELKTILLT